MWHRKTVHGMVLQDGGSEHEMLFAAAACVVNNGWLCRLQDRDTGRTRQSDALSRIVLGLSHVGPYQVLSGAFPSPFLCALLRCQRAALCRMQRTPNGLQYCAVCMPTVPSAVRTLPDMHAHPFMCTRKSMPSMHGTTQDSIYCLRVLSLGFLQQMQLSDQSLLPVFINLKLSFVSRGFNLSLTTKIGGLWH